MIFVFIGAPGSGKGTQSSRLAAKLSIPCLSTGDMLRASAASRHPEGIKLRRMLATGSLVDDEIVSQVVAERLQRPDMVNAIDRGFILDGFPRTVKQALFLDNLLADLGLPRPTVIHLEVSRSGMVRRLAGRRQCATCGSVYNLISRPSLRGSRCENDGGALVERDDDRESVILKRLDEFERSSAPLIDYYASADYHRIDGDRNADLIAADLMEIAALEQLALPA